MDLFTTNRQKINKGSFIESFLKVFESAYITARQDNQDDQKQALRAFKHHLEKFDRQYVGAYQHDAYQLLGLIIQELENELHLVKSPSPESDFRFIHSGAPAEIVKTQLSWFNN